MLRHAGTELYNAPAMIVVELHDEASAANLAARIAGLASSGDVIALRGDLGVGKTTFARAFLRARGNREEEVPSPTFTLVQVYEIGAVPVWHFDLYRLRAPEEAWELGIEDAFSAGISLIEWPERLGHLLPERRLEIAFEFGNRPSARRISFDPGTGWQTRLAAMAVDA
jgi:tRNA threonylcarbamoyladenosine biosynthesis protein TsaE